jgi:hypothetical protein
MTTSTKRHTSFVPLPLLALAAGGILVAVGHAISTPIEGTGDEYVARFAASRGEHFAGLLITTIGALLFVPGLAGVLRALDGRSPLARIGAALAGIGAAALGVGDGVIAMVMGTLTANDPGLAARVYDAMDRSDLAGLPFMFAPLFVLGFVLLGIALVRIGGPLRWAGGLLAIGAILVVVSESGGLMAAATLTPLAAGSVSVAWLLWRGPVITGAAVRPASSTSHAPALTRRGSPTCWVSSVQPHPFSSGPLHFPDSGQRCCRRPFPA